MLPKGDIKQEKLSKIDFLVSITTLATSFQNQLLFKLISEIYAENSKKLMIMFLDQFLRSWEVRINNNNPFLMGKRVKNDWD